MPFQKGVPRAPTSGMKKGYRYPRTLQREKVEEAIRAHILSHAEELVRAQVQHAKGVAYLVLRRPDGTYARATDEKQINAALAVGGETFDINTQAPSTPAFSALMDRALGKPKETHDVAVTVADVRGILDRRHKKSQ